MADEKATSTYLIAEPFDRAVNLVRKVLSGANLKIVGELNMSGRLQRGLLIRTVPCTVLCAYQCCISLITWPRGIHGF